MLNPWDPRAIAERERQLRISRQCLADQMRAQGATPEEISKTINPEGRIDDSEAPYHPYPF